MSQPSHPQESSGYGIALLVELLFVAAGFLMYVGDSARAAESGFWLMVLFGGGAVVTAAMWLTVGRSHPSSSTRR